MMNAVMFVFHILMGIADSFWGLPMLLLTGAIAVIYTVMNRGFQFTHFGYAMKETLGKTIKERGSRTGARGISSFKALCMALSNTIGVGNIAGVSLAIALGGPGAVFWIWVAGVLGMIIKYGEIVLGCKYHEIDPETGMYYGGIMWYIEKGIGKNWKWLAAIYAVVYILSGINGPGVQVNTLATSVTAYFEIPSMLIGVILAGLIGAVLLGGLKRISEFAGKVVPLMSVMYLVITVAIVVIYIRQVPETIGMIFRYAFSDCQAIAGGFGGAGAAMAIRYGIARGFYSNGAGTGDSPFAHSSVDVSHPSEQGIWGIAEVAVDALVCTGTALMVLLTGAWETGQSGAPLTASAVSMAFHSDAFGNIFIILMVLFFSLTTAIMSAYCGEISLKFFTQRKPVIMGYRCIVCLYVIFCTNAVFVERLDIVWRIADFNTIIAMVVSITSLFLLRKDVAECTREYKEIIKQKAGKRG